jgi:hypothetical protein
MQNQPGGLVVRQSERHRCDIPARLVIDPAHAERVVLTKSARAADGSVAATVIDCSLGGLGIKSKVFIPKGCRLIAVIGGDGVGGAMSADIEGEFAVRVQRVIMLDREPNYLIGTLHVRDTAEDVDAGPSAALRRLIEFAKTMWTDQAGVRRA